MKKRKLKITVLLLSLSLVLAAFPVSVFAIDTAQIVDNGECGSSTTYTLTSDGVLTISGTGEMDKKPNWNFNEYDVKEIVVEDTITKIGAGAFMSFKGLHTLQIKGNAIIDNSAFSGCSNLVTAVMPEVTTVKEHAFSCCSNLSSITADSIQYIGVFAFTQTALTDLFFPNLMMIEECAFDDCKELTTVSAPKLRTISDCAFRDCASLKTINCPSVEELGAGAFYRCASLKNVELSSVKNVGDTPFSMCSALTEINLPKLERLEPETSLAAKCENLKRISLPSLISYDYLFSACPVTSLNLPKLTDLDTRGITETLTDVVLNSECYVNFPFSENTTVHILVNDIEDKFRPSLQNSVQYATVHKVPKDVELTVANNYDTYKCVSPDCSFTSSDSTNLTRLHTLQIIPAKNGVIKSNRPKNMVFDKGTIQVTFSANPGYRIKSIIIDGQEQTPSLYYNFKNVTGIHTVSAVFEPTSEKLIAGVKNTKIIYPKAVKYKKGIKVTWKKTSGYKMDGYQVWRSTKKTSGFKKMTEKRTCSYYNTKSLKKGVTYYYKIRGYRMIEGKRYYTAYRTISRHYK